MEEYWDVYNKFREKTGKIIKRDSNQWLQKGEYHIVITGIIQNSKKQILITKRKIKKYFRDYGNVQEVLPKLVKLL